VHRLSHSGNLLVHDHVVTAEQLRNAEPSATKP
jgi:hypothetical protein